MKFINTFKKQTISLNESMKVENFIENKCYL
jgi:hypothetical protein